MLRQLRRGVELDDGLAKVDAVKVLDAASSRVLLEIVIHEGRNRVVRRIMDAVGRPVSRLVRTSLGPVQLGSLKAGRVRHLTRHEVAALYQLVDL